MGTRLEVRGREVGGSGKKDLNRSSCPSALFRWHLLSWHKGEVVAIEINEIMVQSTIYASASYCEIFLVCFSTERKKFWETGHAILHNTTSKMLTT